MKVTAALCAFLLATAAQAAEIKVLSQADEVTSTPALIAIKGKLNQGDDATFRVTLGNIRAAIVFLESPGGSLTAAISIGLTIRKRRLETAVADGATCTSACAMAWLGGTPRRMGEGARVGFHEPWDPKTKESSLKGNVLIASYVRQLGLPLGVVTFIVNAGPRSMAWLTEASSSAYRIFYVELRRDQAERYREVLIALHADAPVPARHITIDGNSPPDAVSRIPFPLTTTVRSDRYLHVHNPGLGRRPRPYILGPRATGATAVSERAAEAYHVRGFPTPEQTPGKKEEEMDETTIDRAAMGRLADALAFICGADHPTTIALKAAFESGVERDIKKARTMFLRLKPSDRRAALTMLND